MSLYRREKIYSGQTNAFSLVEILHYSHRLCSAAAAAAAAAGLSPLLPVQHRLRAPTTGPCLGILSGQQ